MAPEARPMHPETVPMAPEVSRRIQRRIQRT